MLNHCQSKKEIEIVVCTQPKSRKIFLKDFSIICFHSISRGKITPNQTQFLFLSLNLLAFIYLEAVWVGFEFIIFAGGSHCFSFFYCLFVCLKEIAVLWIEAGKCNRMVYPGKVGRKDKGRETKTKDEYRFY